MTAQIVMNDGGGPVTGSKDNGTLAATVNLSNFDNTGVLGWLWELVDKPIGSSATLSSTTSATPNFVPDVRGTYLVRLKTYTDAARTVLDGADEQGYAVRLESPFDWRVPAAGETDQFDGDRGWASAREDAIRDTHSFMNSGVPQLVGAINTEIDFADGLVVLGGFVLNGGDLPALALKLRLVGSLTVAGAGTGELTLWDMGAVGGGPTAPVKRATATIPNASAGDFYVADTALTPDSAPGVNIGEIHDSARRYELRGQVVGGAGGDTLHIANGGITLES